MALIVGMDPVRSISLLFFFAFFAFACQGRFLAIFFSSFGLDNDDVGFLLAAGGLVGLISNPFWTGSRKPDFFLPQTLCHPKQAPSAPVSLR